MANDFREREREKVELPVTFNLSLLQMARGINYYGIFIFSFHLEWELCNDNFLINLK